MRKLLLILGLCLLIPTLTWIIQGQVRPVTGGGTGGGPTTTYIYNQTIYQTQTVNQTITTNLTVYQTNINNYTIITNLTVIQTNIVNEQITTNLTVVNDFRVARFSTFNTFLTTNGISTVQSNMTSTVTTNQIDVGAGPDHYYWTNMVTNVVCQLTNTWGAGVSNRTISMFFQGATNNGPNFTVTLLVPNPAGVTFYWGAYILTNGSITFTVTNNHATSTAFTPWRTNVIEGLYTPLL